MMNGLYQSKQVQSSTCLQLRVPYLCKSRRTIGSLFVSLFVLFCIVCDQSWMNTRDWHRNLKQTRRKIGTIPLRTVCRYAQLNGFLKDSRCARVDRELHRSAVSKTYQKTSQIPAFPTLNYEGMHPSTIRDADKIFGDSKMP